MNTPEFYPLLPNWALEWVAARAKKQGFAEESKAAAEEQARARRVAHDLTVVGLYGDQPVRHPTLWASAERNLELLYPMYDDSEYDSRVLSRTRISQLDRQKKQAQTFTDWAITASLGYCGWLCMNRTYRRESWELYRKVGSALYRSADVRAATTAGTEVQPFLTRWWLTGLAGPALPIAERPQFLTSAAAATTDGAGARAEHASIPSLHLYLPAYSPPPRQHQLRKAVDLVRQNEEWPSHLKAWNKIVRSGNRSRQSVQRYARLFRLQYALSILDQRYPRTTAASRMNLYSVLASHLGARTHTVRADIAMLARQK